MKVKQIREGFKNITKQETVAAAGSAYAEFHKLIEDEQETFSPETVVKLGEMNELYVPRLRLVRSAITQVHPPRFSPHGEHYFRGSGVIVLGSADGEILAVDTGYSGQGDAVADKYGEKYVRVAVRKAGQAAYYLAVQGMTDGVLDKQETIENLLIAQGLKTIEQDAHHHGYAVGDFHHSVGSELVAGASGMLPSLSVHNGLLRKMKEDYKQGIDLGLFDWEPDFLAGYHDEVAAHEAVKLSPSVSRVGNLSLHINETKSRIQKGHNLH